MADEDDDPDAKTEDPTPRRLQEARERGQVAFSGELVSAVLLAGWLGAFLFAGGALLRALAGSLRNVVENASTRAREDLTIESAAAFVEAFARETLTPTLALMLVSLALAALAGYGQAGLVIAPKALELDLGKLDPNKGLRKLFGVRSLLRTGLSLVKTLVIVGVTALMAWLQLAEITSIVALEVGPALVALGQVVLRCLVATLIAIVAIGVFDWFMQRRAFDKELRMSKKELKEEARQSEGDPHVKARIRRLQREMAQRRMMSEVPKATVVITNPTHYAVALSYEREAPAERRGAPRVVAKGVDLVAQRIKELAREAGVVVYENAPLARSLHARCEIGDQVPVELYEAVAQVLAYVFEVHEHSPRRAERARPELARGA